MQPARIGLTFLACVLSTVVLEAQDGGALFTHEWTGNDSLSPGGDGLGPVFNGRSCVECHHLGGTGGAGGIEKNMDFLSNTNQRTIQKLRLIRAHSGFQERDGLPKDTIILHRFSLDNEYSQIRNRLIQHDGAQVGSPREQKRVQRAMSVEPVQTVRLSSLVSAVRTQRNSTALFGAGWIDQISDQALVRFALDHQPASPNVSGRLSVLGATQPGETVRLGRFGWRGQTSRLHDFIVDACAFELGLESSHREQTPDPRNSKYRPPGVDLSDLQLASLTRFVAQLPRPNQKMPGDTVKRERVIHGSEVFHQVGCADCHVESLAGVEGIYSDLMLHDMGDSLADPVPASRAMNSRSIPASLGRTTPVDNELTASRPVPSGGSYGTSVSFSPSPIFDFVDSRTTHEWRTPPLWGVADSAPYMHDGRASTLVEAIAAHGGESTDSVEAYFGANTQDQLVLIEFLKTLRAPETR